jgi:hypothetical protein
MKYIRIWDINALLKGNEPGKLVEKSTIDRKNLKKIEIPGQLKQLLTLENKGRLYIISPFVDNLDYNDSLIKVNANLDFSKSAYENKYKGIQIELSGRLRGAQRARNMVKKFGSLNQQSFSSKLQFSKRNIYTK